MHRWWGRRRGLPLGLEKELRTVRLLSIQIFLIEFFFVNFPRECISYVEREAIVVRTSAEPNVEDLDPRKLPPVLEPPTRLNLEVIPSLCPRSCAGGFVLSR